MTDETDKVVFSRRCPSDLSTILTLLAPHRDELTGVVEVLAIVIMLETGDVARFAQVDDFASYARCVDSARYPNGEKKGEGNTKSGNAYWWGRSLKRRFRPSLQRQGTALLRAEESQNEQHRGNQGTGGWAGRC